MADFPYGSWIGRSSHAEETIAERTLVGLAAVLDKGRSDWYGDTLPPLGHWLCFVPDSPQSELGADGHAARGGSLPPVDLPRRMWAGSRVRFHRPLRVGDRASKRSTITDIVAKHGRSGEMVFVTVRHDIAVGGTLAITEDQDIVYREAPTEPLPPPAAPAWLPEGRRIDPDPVLLFRYSALAFNGHRIHYDHDYVRQVEGYPDLVVHGPLTATLMLDHALAERDPGRLTDFSFRGQRPLFAGASFVVTAAPSDGGFDVAAIAPDGGVAMSGRIGLKS